MQASNEYESFMTQQNFFYSMRALAMKYIKSGESPSSGPKTTSSYIAEICFVQLNGGFGFSVGASMTIILQYANPEFR